MSLMAAEDRGPLPTTRGPYGNPLPDPGHSVRRMNTKLATTSWSVRCLAQTPARKTLALASSVQRRAIGLPQRARTPRLPKRQAQMANAGPAKIELTFADLQAEMPL